MGSRPNWRTKANDEDNDDEVEVNRLTGGFTHKVDIVDRAANKRKFLIIKRDGHTRKQGELDPSGEMSDAELKDLQSKRSDHFGIEILDDAFLTYQDDQPTELDLYADPVNLKYPVDTDARAANARIKFMQTAGEYSEEKSQAVVHERIVRAEISYGMEPSFNPDNALDQLLPDDIKEQLMEPEKKKTVKADPLSEADREKLLCEIRQLKWGLDEIELALDDCVSTVGAALPEEIAEAMGKLVTELEQKIPSDSSEADEMEMSEKSQETKKRIYISWEHSSDWQCDPDKVKEIQTTLRMVRAKLTHAEAMVMETTELPATPASGDVAGMVSEARAILGGMTMDKSEKMDGKKAAGILADVLGGLKAGEPITEEQLNAISQAHEYLTMESDEEPTEMSDKKKSEPTEKAGKPQLSKSRAKKFRGAIGELVKLLEEMDPSLTKEDLWPEKMEPPPASDAAGDKMEKRNEEQTNQTEDVAAIKTELEDVKKKYTELLAEQKKSEDAPAPSNLANDEPPTPTKKNTERRPRSSGFYMDVNDPEFLKSHEEQ